MDSDSRSVVARSGRTNEAAAMIEAMPEITGSARSSLSAFKTRQDDFTSAMLLLIRPTPPAYREPLAEPLALSRNSV
jgi:hypothetical protein